MARTIPELIAAVSAGDPTITQADADRLSRHMRHQQRIDKILLRGVSPEDVARSESAEIGAEFQAYRSEILRNLPRYTPAELRRIVRQQLVLLGWSVEVEAFKEGSTRRHSKDSSCGQKASADKRRKKAGRIRNAVAKLRRAGETKADAARRYLREHDKGWPTATDEQRQRKVDNLTRRFRAPKK